MGWLVCGLAVLGTLGFGRLVNAAGAPGTNIVVSSNPPAGGTIDINPTAIQLVFRDDVKADQGKVVIEMTCADQPIGFAEPQIAADARTVSAALIDIPPAGICTVSWSLPDKSIGSFQFTLTATTETSISSGGGEETPTETTVAIIGEVVPERTGSGPRVGGLIGLLRIVHYLAISAVFGGLIVVLLIWPEGTEYGLSLRFFRLAWLAAVISTYFVVALTAMRSADDGFVTALNPVSWFGSLDGLDGLMLAIRLLFVIASGWVVIVPDRIVDPATQVPALGIVVIMMSTFGLSRLGQNVSFLNYVFGVPHALSVGVWIGGLILLFFVTLTGSGESDLVQAVLGFARLSTTLMGIAVATGVMQMYVLDGFALFTSGHGRLNILTILITAAMIWIALMIKVFAQSRLAKAETLSGKMAWRLRRAVRVELIAGIVVFALTAWAVPMNPPQAKAEATRAAVNYAFRQELENDRFKVVLSITPVETGINAMRIELLKPSRISDFTVNLVPQEIGYEGIAIKPGLKRPGAVIIAGDGLFMLKAPGVWSIEITGATTTGELVPLATTINVAEGAPPTTTVAPTTTVGG
jgi:copper transport protein